MLSWINKIFKKNTVKGDLLSTSDPGHYITLLNGMRVRVVYDREVLEKLARTVGGADKVKQLAKLKGDISSWKIVYWTMIQAGEKADGREFRMSVDDLWRLLSLSHAKEFLDIIHAESLSSWGTLKQDNRSNTKIVSN